MVIVRELLRVEDSLGPLEKEEVVQAQHAQRLREARAEHAELLKRLSKVDYVVRERTHSEGDKAGRTVEEFRNCSVLYNLVARKR
ncbi:hypothetical protein NDU88_001539 [Pleurodeles waltl]|uniref:Uncharacterized protein n=1 Tax=Pleurodeles waltl TaxID=8319 RepID=A0AAV7TI20_PLEWA|nr:hypothetical protein NDU88_001539 [Pleurodeles waltl]